MKMYVNVQFSLPFGVQFSRQQDSSTLLMHTVHAPSMVSPVSNGYIWNVASLIREIIWRSSFLFPNAPVTLDTFLSSNENSDQTKLMANFCLEQLEALMLARKLGVKCRSCEGTCWGATGVVGMSGDNCCCESGVVTCWEATGVVGGNSGWENCVVGGNSYWRTCIGIWEDTGVVGGMTGYSQFDASLWILGGNGSMCWDTDCSILRTCSRTKLHHILDAFLLWPQTL